MQNATKLYDLVYAHQCITLSHNTYFSQNSSKYFHRILQSSNNIFQKMMVGKTSIAASSYCSRNYEWHLDGHGFSLSRNVSVRMWRQASNPDAISKMGNNNNSIKTEFMHLICLLISISALKKLKTRRKLYITLR